MRFMRLALVVLIALVVRSMSRRPSHYDLSASYSSHLTDQVAVDRVAKQLNDWEHQLRARGFNAVATTGGSNIRSGPAGADMRTESHDVTLVGKMDRLGRVQVRIRTDQDLSAEQQAFVELQAQRKDNSADAWDALGKTAKQLLVPDAEQRKHR
jgi:hypothetical protein